MATFKITGLSIGGFSGSARGANLPDERQVAGATVKFGPATNGRRQVCINGSVHMDLGSGSISSLKMNGINIRSEGSRLWVSGVEVDFDGPQDPNAAREAAAAAVRAQATLKARYPGVSFNGQLSPDQIDDDVQIVPGARIDLASGIEIHAGAVIGATANLTGGVINGGRIDGDVSGGVLNGCVVQAGASVSGGVLNGANINAGGSVSGGILNGTKVGAGRHISGGIN